MSLLCTIKNLNLVFGSKIIFKDAALSISTGDRIGLLGLNGKGKSTLFKILSSDIVPDQSTPPFEFTRARGENDPQKRFSLFYVPQELPLEEQSTITIRDYFFRFYPELKVAYQRSLDEFEQLNGWTLTQEYESYLKYFGLNNLDLPVSALSGGEQKKILLSLGLSSNANLILWDEPTNHLDIETIKIFEDELSLTNKAFILISHDRYLLSKLTKRILHINHGRIETFEGSYTDYLDFLEQHEKAKMSLLNKLKNNLAREQAWMRQGIKARGTRSKKRVENFLDLKDKVSQSKNEAKKLLDLSLTKSNRQTKVLMSFENVSFQYPHKPLLFEGITGEILKGNKIGLLGRNGVGKTTLIKLLKQDIFPTSGQTKMAEQLVIQYFSQRRDELDSDKTPYQVLGDGNDYVILSDGSKKHVHSYFESFLFHRDDIHRPLKTFSGGEKSRLQLALNLTKAGDILIFDEPTNDLDLETIQILEDRLARFEGAVLLISHDRAFLSAVTNKVWLIEDKKIQNFEGGYDQVAPYLEMLELEKELKEEENQSVKIAPAPEAPKVEVVDKKLTQKNKQRIEAIYVEIETTESKLGIIEEKLATIDYSKEAQSVQAQMKILTEAQEQLTTKISSLYQELESLES